MTAAERRRRCRGRRMQNEAGQENYKSKHRERYHAKKHLVKDKDMSVREKRAVNRKWRQEKRKQRVVPKNLMSVVSISQVNPDINKSTYIKREINYKTGLEEDFNDSEKSNSEQDTTLVQCPLCKDDNRRSVEDLREHYKKKHKRKLLPSTLYSDVGACEVCGKKFNNSKYGLSEHMKTHDNCMYCDVCGITNKTLIDHVLHRRIHSDETAFKCIFCEYATDCLKEITEHVNKNHDMIHKYHCTKCNKGFPFLTWFQEHDNYHSGAKPYVCDLCGKAFPYSRYLPAHKKYMHKEDFTDYSNLHFCVVCKNQYRLKKTLKRHMISHTSNQSICDICGKKLSNTEKLKLHMRRHTGYKPYTCEDCGKSFITKPYLIKHIRVHTGEKPYVCKYCSKAFSQKGSLTIHNRRHTGERPYACEYCSKAFLQLSHLRVHVRSHTGERPYVCSVCNKGFASQVILNIHLKTLHHLI